MIKHKDKGVLYVATGAGFTEMAIASAKSLKEHTSGIKVHLFTDQPNVQSKWIDSTGEIENSHVRSKVDYIHQSPFQYTLFLDADTKIVADISELFQLLDRFDMAIAHAQQRNHFPTLQNWKTELPYAFPQMNSGVVLFRANELTKKLFEDWQEAYHNNGFHKDQVTLRELIWNSALRISILPPEYNIRFVKYLDIWTEKETQPKILHFAAYKDEFEAHYQDAQGKKQTRKQRFQERWIKLKWIWKELKSLV